MLTSSIEKINLIFMCQAAVRIIKQKELMILQIQHQQEIHLKLGLGLHE